MITLGIESTAHTFGAGLCEGKRILASERTIYVPSQGGIHPREAAESHAANAPQTISKALEKASLRFDDIDLIAFSQGPGLGPCLRVGAFVARYLAAKHLKEVIGVNHAVAHIEIGRLTTGANDAVHLYVSGGNTQIISFSEGRYRIFGETLDIPIGNALDTFSLGAGMGHPGGPKIEKLALNGKYVRLPYVVKGMDLSFSGIVTEAKRKAGKEKLEDICFSLQETCFAMLVEVTERAMAHLNKDEVLLIGGVAANKRFGEMLGIMCRERGASAFAVPQEYAGDNGAMIAWLGALMKESGHSHGTRIRPKWRADEVEVTWM